MRPVSFLSRFGVRLFAWGALVALVSTAPAARAAPGQRTLRFAVERDGLNFTGPCSAVAYRTDRGQDPNSVVENLSDIGGAEVELDAGRYDVVVTCPSTEGALAQTFPIDLRRGGKDLVARMEPAFVLANVTRNGGEPKATVTVVDAFGRQVAKGAAKTPLPVPAGKHVVNVSVVEKFGRKKLAMTGSAPVRAKVGARQNVAVDLSDAVVTIDLRDNGKKAEGLASLMIPGTNDRAFELRVGEATNIPPGTYDLVTQIDQSHDFHTVRQKNVKLAPNAKKTLRAQHATGGVLAKMRLDGKGVPIGADGEKVDVLLFLGAAPKEFNILDGGEAARLAPGKYRVAIRRKTALDDGSEWIGEEAVNVRRGATRSVTIDVTPARWTIKTRLGSKEKAMEVAVLTEKGTAPLLKRQSAGGELSLALPPGIYRAQVTLPLAQGPLTQESRVVLKRGQTKATAFTFDVGVAVVQVMDKGMAVPATVQFFPPGTAAPTLEIKAGREALLPPGRYALKVKRRGKTKTFGEIVVNTKRPIERTIDFSADEAAAK